MFDSLESIDFDFSTVFEKFLPPKFPPLIFVCYVFFLWDDLMKDVNLFVFAEDTKIFWP